MRVLTKPRVSVISIDRVSAEIMVTVISMIRVKKLGSVVRVRT